MTLSRTLGALFIGAALVASGCDDGGAATEPTVETDATTPTEEADTAEPTVEADTTEPTAEPEVVDPGPSYPEGPYGLEVGDTIKDMGFYDPWSGETVKLSDLYNDDSVKVIFLSSAAGWCTACMYEAWDLVPAYDKYHEDGLAILYTLYADTQDKPLWRPQADADEIDRDFTFMNQWVSNLGVYIGLEPKREANYPTLVDIGFQLEEYQPEAATPLTIMIRKKDMKIIYLEVGYGGGTIAFNIKTQLYAPQNQ